MHNCIPLCSNHKFRKLFDLQPTTCNGMQFRQAPRPLGSVLVHVSHFCDVHDCMTIWRIYLRFRTHVHVLYSSSRACIQHGVFVVLCYISRIGCCQAVASESNPFRVVCQVVTSESNPSGVVCQAVTAEGFSLWLFKQYVWIQWVRPFSRLTIRYTYEFKLTLAKLRQLEIVLSSVTCYISKLTGQQQNLRFMGLVFELMFDRDYEIYGSTIGVCNSLCHGM